MDVIQHYEHTQNVGAWRFVADVTRSLNMGSPPPLIEPENIRGVVRARVNHSRWIVDCPDRGCPGAEMASLREPYYYCVYSRNESNGGLWYTIQYPTDKQAIEAVLLRRDEAIGRTAGRPCETLRSWSPVDVPELNLSAQTRSELEAENVELGIR